MRAARSAWAPEDGGSAHDEEMELRKETKEPFMVAAKLGHLDLEIGGMTCGHCPPLLEQGRLMPLVAAAPVRQSRTLIRRISGGWS